MGHDEHKKMGRELFEGSIGFAVITVSDTRGFQDDENGIFIGEAVKRADFKVSFYEIVHDKVEDISATLRRAIEEPSVDLVVINGGTGISTKDVTPEAVKPLFDKELPGFGELFRYLSFLEIESSAMISRACAGIVHGKPVFLLPGSKNAVILAMEKLILPEAEHLLYEIRKGGVLTGERF